MKKTAIILLTAIGISQAQVKVLTNGNVGIGTTNPGARLEVQGNQMRLRDPLRGTVFVYDQGIGNIGYSIRTQQGGGWAWQLIDGNNNVYSNTEYPTGNMYILGNMNILGNTLSLQNGFGRIGGYNYTSNSGAVHIDVLVNGIQRNVWKVDYVGNSYLYGIAYSQQTWLWSDKKLKTNIKTCENALTKVLSIRGVDYNPVDSMEVLEIVPPQKAQVATDTISKSISQNISASAKPEFKKVNKPYGVNNTNKDQIGFIAQELEIVLPQAVKTDENGLKAVNYIAVIPLLVEAIKEQQTQIETLKADVKKMKGQKGAAKTEDSNSAAETTKDAILYQNTPNPTSGETQIKYFISETTQSAFITISDLTGKQVKLVTLNTKGESSISIKANELQAGIYLYTLVRDGNIVDSKRMVIVE